MILQKSPLEPYLRRRFNLGDTKNSLPMPMLTVTSIGSKLPFQGNPAGSSPVLRRQSQSREGPYSTPMPRRLFHLWFESIRLPCAAVVQLVRALRSPTQPRGGPNGCVSAAKVMVTSPVKRVVVGSSPIRTPGSGSSIGRALNFHRRLNLGHTRRPCARCPW